MSALIGIVGEPGSGKDTAANYLVKKYGFTHVSTGDIIRHYIKDHHLGETTRDNIQKTIEKLRQQNGPDVLVAQVLSKPTVDRLVLSGLRHPAEAQAIKDRSGIIIALLAPQKDRFSRSSRRARVGDNINYEEFKHLEARENGKDTAAYNIQAIIDSANMSIYNDGSFKTFYSKIDQVMEQCGIKPI